MDALIQRAQRLLGSGSPDGAPPGAAAAGERAAAPAWVRSWEGAAGPTGVPAEQGPAAAGDALAAYMADAGRRTTPDSAWDEGSWASRRDASCSVSAAPATAEQAKVGGGSLDGWIARFEQPGQCGAAPAARAAPSDAEAWQRWLAREVSRTLPCLLVALPAASLACVAENSTNNAARS